MDRIGLVRSGTDLIALLVLLLLLERPVQKSLRLRHFKSDQDEIWSECSSRKYASIDGEGFVIWRQNFKTAVITSFHAEKFCHKVSEHEAFVPYAATYASS